jgi:DGQHR domain-containing protein
MTHSRVAPVERRSPTLRLPALEIRQGPSRTVYGFAVDAKLLSTFTSVSRIRRRHGRIHGYQRPEVVAHVASIRKYLESPDPLLPNALVVAFDSRVTFEPLAGDGGTTVARHGSLVIPVDPRWNDEDKPGWAVDGQQRWAAISDAAVPAFPVLVGAFVTDCVEEQRRQFILLNATKPLPKGLVHELLPATTGELPARLRRHRFPAYLLDRLNHDDDSPMRGRIRTPTEPDGIIRDNSVLRMLENSLSDGALYDQHDAAAGDGDGDAMLAVLKPFWSAVATVFPEAWELPPRRSRLTHGVGIAAMGYVMDALAARRPNTSRDEFARGLAPLRDICRWTSGTWDFGRGRQRPWNDLQNLGKDIQLLTRHLLAHVERPPSNGPSDA